MPVIHLPRSPLTLLMALATLCLAGLVAHRSGLPAQSSAELPAFDRARGDPEMSDLQEQAAAVDDLTWLVADRDSVGLPPGRYGRADLLAHKRRLSEGGDSAGVARLNAILAGEAFARASRVVARWAEQHDPASGLLPRSRLPGEQVWEYQNSGADLFGHLTIGTYFLKPERLDAMLGTLATERARQPGLADDLALPGGQPRGLTHEERVFGTAEYAKDGLLPLFERLGPEPWLGRLRELADAVLAESRVPTPRGPIPADSAEVNGDVLQVLVRLAWATGDLRYRAAADRIALAYLDVLPTTRYLPPYRWDFMEGEPLARRRFRLSDHGNEIFSGLIEWHLAETLRRDSDAAQHRRLLRLMLDRVLEKGRNPDGLWYRVLEIPSGKVDDKEGLTDNWGYLLQAYWTAAMIEDRAPDGDPVLAERYRLAVRRALEALPRYSFYDWQKGEMDGYADTIESAIYMLDKIDVGVSDAAAWVDEQMPVLYGFQSADGKVEDSYLDGNFVRSLLLYAFSQTQGLTVQPWREGVLVGAAPNGACLDLALATQADWSGRVVFDTPRHRLHLGAPIDYARLNEWPEWFVAEPERLYEVRDLASGRLELRSGAELAEGLPVTLRDDVEQRLRICPA